MSADLFRRDLEASRTRTRWTLGVSFVLHGLAILWMLRFHEVDPGPPAITEISWLEPKDLEAPKPVPPPVVKAEPKPPAPRPVVEPVHEKPRAAAPKPAATTPHPARPKPHQSVSPVAQPKPAPAAALAGPPALAAGEKGRQAGARVAQDLRRTTAGMDELLSSLNGTLAPGGGMPVAGNGSGSALGGGGGRGKYKLAGGRGTSELGSVEGTARGAGLGQILGGRGVHKNGVAIVDQGVESSGDGASSSGRDSRSLMATVQRYVAGIKFCYDNSLKKAPQLTGKITLQMDIAASGEVQGLETLDDSMGNAALERCVVSQAQGWRFAAIASGTVRFTLPLVFTPPQGVAP